MNAGLVAVVGPAAADARAPDLDDAYEVGRLLAARGLAVLTGGMDGVMAAAARGARDAGGTAVGMLPGRDPAAGNPYLTLALPTGLGQLRNALLVDVADALVAVGCSWGTLSEIALARRAGKPLVCVRPWLLRDTSGAEVPVPTAVTPQQAAELIGAVLPAQPPG